MLATTWRLNATSSIVRVWSNASYPPTRTFLSHLGRSSVPPGTICGALGRRDPLSSSLCSALEAQPVVDGSRPETLRTEDAHVPRQHSRDVVDCTTCLLGSVVWTATAFRLANSGMASTRPCSSGCGA